MSETIELRPVSGVGGTLTINQAGSGIFTLGVDAAIANLLAAASVTSVRYGMICRFTDPGVVVTGANFGIQKTHFSAGTTVASSGSLPASGWGRYDTQSFTVDGTQPWTVERVNALRDIKGWIFYPGGSALVTLEVSDIWVEVTYETFTGVQGCVECGTIVGDVVAGNITGQVVSGTIVGEVRA